MDNDRRARIHRIFDATWAEASFQSFARVGRFENSRVVDLTSTGIFLFFFLYFFQKYISLEYTLVTNVSLSTRGEICVRGKKKVEEFQYNLN